MLTFGEWENGGTISCITEPQERADQRGGRYLHWPISLTHSAVCSTSCSGADGAPLDHGHWCPLCQYKGAQ